MGSCYSGLGSKSPLSSSDTPFEKSYRRVRHSESGDKFSDNYKYKNSDSINNTFDSSDRSKSLSKSSNNNQLLQSSSFEHLSVSEVMQKNQLPANINRRKIPIPSKLGAHMKVAPIRHSQELVEKYENQIRVFKSNEPVKEFLIPESSSSSTSVDSSANSSVNLSKSSIRSSSSSANSVIHPHSSIPKPKSRSPTPPSQVRVQPPNRIRNVPVSNDNRSFSVASNNCSSAALDRQNGNRTHPLNINNNLINENANSDRITISKSSKHTANMKGLPRPQTAQIISTNDLRNTNETNINRNSNVRARETRETRSVQYYKPINDNSHMPIMGINNTNPPSYYYGMNKSSSSCPYKRPLNNKLSLPLQYNNNTHTSMDSAPVSLKASHTINSNSKSTPLAYPSSSTSSLSSMVEPHKTQHEVTSNTLINNLAENRPSRIKLSNKIILNRNANDGKRDETNVMPRNLEKKNDDDDDEVFPKSYQQIKLANSDVLRNSNPIKSKDTNYKSYNEKHDQSSPPSVSEKTTPEHTCNSMSSTSGTETERDFLIDDEICDQPELVLSATLDQADLTIKSSLSELEALRLKQRHDSVSSSSSPKSIGTASSSPSTVVANTTFRRPRPLSFVESPDGSKGLDSPSFRAACQDLIGIKTLLFRLQGILQNAETVNPFEHNYVQNKLYQQLYAEDQQNGTIDSNFDSDISQENLDLKRQIVFMQHQLEDKDRTIKLLQQQMAKYLNINEIHTPRESKREMLNAASQTDRCKNMTGVNPNALSDGSNGMLVSTCCTHLINWCECCKKSWGQFESNC